MQKSTHGHGEAIVWEELGHQVEKVVIVLIEHDSLERNLPEQWLEALRELALDRPVLLGDRFLELLDGSVKLGMERFL